MFCLNLESVKSISFNLLWLTDKTTTTIAPWYINQLENNWNCFSLWDQLPLLYFQTVSVVKYKSCDMTWLVTSHWVYLRGVSLGWCWSPVSPSALHPGTFDDFLRSWKMVELASQDTVSIDQSLDTDESILKLSQAVKSDLGFGCIGLTHKRSVQRDSWTLLYIHLENTVTSQLRSLWDCPRYVPYMIKYRNCVTSVIRSLLLSSTSTGVLNSEVMLSKYTNAENLQSSSVNVVAIKVL